MSAQPVDVLAQIDADDRALAALIEREKRWDVRHKWQNVRANHAAMRAAVAELIERTDRVAATLESPTLARQSTKNPNAGFIDWRDWCALRGEVMALRAALARCGGAS